MKKVYGIVVSLVLLGVLGGTVADVAVSQALYSPGSPFGEFLAAVAMAPIFTLLPIATGLLFGALLAQFEKLKASGRILCSLAQVFGVFVTYVTIKGFQGSRHLHGLSFEGLVLLVIGCFLLSAALGAHASRSHPQEVLIVALIGVVAVCGSRFLLDALKNLWGRQRFWSIDDIATQFTPWYWPQFPTAERRALMGDAIKSFPSGHSLGTISVLWLSLFPSFVGFCQKNEKAWSAGIAIFAICFWSLTIVARMILGEHFLSDVCMRALVFMLLFTGMNLIAERFGERLYKGQMSPVAKEG